MEHHERRHQPELTEGPRERRAKNPEKLSKSERVSYRVFKEQAKDWKLTADADDYCPKHWEAMCEKLEQDEGFIADSGAVGAKGMHGRYWNAAENSWVVYCQGEDADGTLCQESIHVPVDAQEE